MDAISRGAFPPPGSELQRPSARRGRGGVELPSLYRPYAPPPTPVLLTEAELATLYAVAASQPIVAFYLVLLTESGLRARSEALWRRWRDVDRDGRFLWGASGRAHWTKSKSGRGVPMRPAYRDHAAWNRLAGATWFFAYDLDRRGHKARDRIASLRGVRAA